MTIINKYIWVINTLLKAGEKGLSLKEINERWIRNDMSYGEPIPRQTFNRWKWAIQDTMGVVIECDKNRGYRYYIFNPNELESGELKSWLLNTYTTYNILSNNVKLKNRILVEEIPSSKYFLTDILDAMHNNSIIELSYTNFVGGDTHIFKVAPYCVKMAMKRWYVLALNTYNNKLRVYGLDRIDEVRKTNEKFEMPKEFDAKEYFSSVFGIVNSENLNVEKIVLRADKYHQNYLRSLPLHHSQKETFTSEEYSEFELHLKPTYDFCFELLSRGGMLEVLEPQSLRHMMHNYVWEMWEMYKND